MIDSEAMNKREMSEEMREFFRKQGARGGKIRTEKYSQKTISEWGKKGAEARKKKFTKKELSKITSKGHRTRKAKDRQSGLSQ